VLKDFPAVLTELRRSAGESQRQAADALGVSQSLLSHYENGVREPKLEFMVRAAEHYGASLDYLMGRTVVKINPFLGEQYATTGLNCLSPETQQKLTDSAKLVMNALTVVYGLCSYCDCMDIIDDAEKFFSIEIYHIVRAIRMAGRMKNFDFLRVNAGVVQGRCSLAVNFILSSLVSRIESMDCPPISLEEVQRRFPGSFECFMSVLTRADEILGECPSLEIKETED